MEKNLLNISDELIENLSIEQLTDLSMEAEDLLLKLENITQDCEEVLNS